MIQCAIARGGELERTGLLLGQRNEFRHRPYRNRGICDKGEWNVRNQGDRREILDGIIGPPRIKCRIDRVAA